MSECPGRRMYSLQKYIQYRNAIVLNYKKLLELQKKKENPIVFAIQTGSLVRCLCILKLGGDL